MPAPTTAAASRTSLDSSDTTLHDMSLTPSVGFDPLATRPTSQHTLGAIGPAPAQEKRGAQFDDKGKPLGWLEHACLNLSPAFFSLNMGTGIASILLYNLPYNADWLRYIAIAIFVLNIVIFAILCAGTVARLVRWRGIFTALGRHTLAGMYWGCLPMGMVTIINMVAFVCVPAWGYHWALLAVGLWWINVVMSVFTNIGMIFMIMSRQKHTLETITAPLLLPIVCTVVAGASGGIVANALSPFHASMARSIVIVSYVVLGTGIPIAMFFTTLWLYRTAVVGLPAPGALPSLFLPLGPCGQGAFGLVLLGHVVRDLAYTHQIGFTIAPASASATSQGIESMLRVADAVYAAGLVSALFLWGLGLVWYTLAMVITLEHALRNGSYFSYSTFSIGWTAYTFPIGVWATATTQLAKELDSPAFKVIGTLISLQVVLQWAYVFGMACWKGWHGAIFVAPELSEWEGARPPLRWCKRHQEGDA